MGPLIDPFLDNGFMLRALLAGILVSAACAVVGTFVVLRGLAFIGDALAHGVLPGIACGRYRKNGRFRLRPIHSRHFSV